MQIKDKIEVQVMRNLHKAKNITLRAEFMLKDGGRYESSRRNYGSDNSRAPVDNEVVVHEIQPYNDRLNKDKAAKK